MKTCGIPHLQSKMPRENHTPVTARPEAKVGEAVIHPAHYGGDVPHETIKCLEAWGLESDALLWNAAKYISRAGKKGKMMEDLRKAQFYLQRRIDSLEGK